MTHHIDKDTVKGIITVIHHDLIQHHDLWQMSRDVIAQLEGSVNHKILMDMRAATLKIEDWEKKEFAEAHKAIVKRTTRIAALIKQHDPQYRDYLHFEILCANQGIRFRIFDDERRAESWLLLPLE